MTATSTRTADAVDLSAVAALRFAVTRLARQLRQEALADGGLTPSKINALASINRVGPMSLCDLAEVATKAKRRKPAKRWNQEGNHREVAVMEVLDYDRGIGSCDQFGQTLLPLAKSPNAMNSDDDAMDRSCVGLGINWSRH